MLVKNANDNANEKQAEYIVTFKAWISFNLLTPKRSTYVVRHGHVGQFKKKSRCWISLTIEHRIEKNWVCKFYEQENFYLYDNYYGLKVRIYFAKKCLLWMNLFEKLILSCDDERGSSTKIVNFTSSWIRVVKQIKFCLEIVYFCLH